MTRQPSNGQIHVHAGSAFVQVSRLVRKVRLRLQPSDDRAELKVGSARERGDRRADHLRAFPTQLAASRGIGIEHDALRIEEEYAVFDILQHGPDPRLAETGRTAG